MANGNNSMKMVKWLVPFTRAGGIVVPLQFLIGKLVECCPLSSFLSFEADFFMRLGEDLY